LTFCYEPTAPDTVNSGACSIQVIKLHTSTCDSAACPYKQTSDTITILHSSFLAGYLTCIFILHRIRRASHNRTENERSYLVSSPPVSSLPSPPQQLIPLHLVKEVIKDSSGVSVHAETVAQCSSLDEAKRYITKEAEGWEE
jgi:hypothetical protein